MVMSWDMLVLLHLATGDHRGLDVTKDQQRVSTGCTSGETEWRSRASGLQLQGRTDARV